MGAKDTANLTHPTTHKCLSNEKAGRGAFFQIGSSICMHTALQRMQGQSGRIVESCIDLSLVPGTLSFPRTQPLTMHPKTRCGSSCPFQYAALLQASSHDSCKLQINMVCFLLISATDTSTAGFPDAPNKGLIKQLPIH